MNELPIITTALFIAIQAFFIGMRLFFDDKMEWGAVFLPTTIYLLICLFIGIAGTAYWVLNMIFGV